MYVNKMNKIGDSYLSCIAMAHSPQVEVAFKNDVEYISHER
jgi:hypothetical protein